MLARAAQGTLSRHPHLPGRAVRRHRRGLRPAVLGGTAADRGDPAHPAPAWCTIHRCPRGQACWASQESGAPRIPARPQVVQEVDEAALTRVSRRCWSLLFLRRRREQRRSFPRWRAGRRIFCFILFLLVPTFSKKEQFPFPPGSQVHGTTVCDALLPHSRPRPILPVAKRVRFGDDIPPHAPLASPVWDPGSSVRMPQNAPTSVPSTPTPFRSPERPCLARGDCCPPGKRCNRAGPSSRDEAGVLQPLLHRIQGRWWPSANPGSASLEPGFAQAPVKDADAQAHDQMHSAPGLVCSDRPEGRLVSRFDPSATQTVSTVCVRRSAWQYRVLPFGLSLSPHVFTK